MADTVKTLAPIEACMNYTFEYQRDKEGARYVDRLYCPFDKVKEFAARIAGVHSLDSLVWAEIHGHMDNGNTAIIYGDINQPEPTLISCVIRSKGVAAYQAARPAVIKEEPKQAPLPVVVAQTPPVLHVVTMKHYSIKVM